MNTEEPNTLPDEELKPAEMKLTALPLLEEIEEIEQVEENPPAPEPEPEPEPVEEEESEEERFQQEVLPMPTQEAAQNFKREETLRLSPIEDREKQQYWQQIMTGDSNRIPEEIQQQAGLDDGEMDEDEREHQLLSTVNRSWVVDHLNKNKQEVRQNWENIRAKLTKKHGVGDNEQELFLALSDEQSGAERKKAATQIQQKSFTAGLQGQITPDTREELASLSDDEQQRALTLQSQAYRQGVEHRDNMLPMAQKIAEGLPAFINTERELLSPLTIDQKMKPLLEIKDELAALPQKERSYVYHLALQERKKIDDAAPAEEEPDALTKAWRTFRRSSFNIGMDMGQAGANVAAATFSSMGKELDSWLGTHWEEKGERIDQKAQVLQELRQLAQQESYPIIHEEEAGLGEKLAHDIVSATPHAILAMSGGAGFGCLMFGGAGASIAEARQRTPKGDVKTQVAAGLIAGAAQAGIYAGLGRIGGRVLEQSIARFARTSGQGFKGFSLASLKTGAQVSGESAKMLLAGKAAQATDLALHELAAQCDETASNIDWKSFGENTVDIELNVREAAATLPFLLIGSGRMALRHFRTPQGLIAQGDSLRAWGIPEKKISNILQAKNIDQQGSLLQEAIQTSPRWGGAGFLKKAMQSLRLLHNKEQQPFNDVDAVCDFLKLPPEHSNIPKNKAQLADISQRETRNQLEKSYSRAQTTKLQEPVKALQLWDYWWQKSNITLSDKYKSNMRQQKRIKHTEDTYSYNHLLRYPAAMEAPDAQIPQKLQRFALISPKTESLRRDILCDRSFDVESLSYQFLLNNSSSNHLPKEGASVEKLIESGEKKRQQLLKHLADCVLQMAQGTPKNEAMDTLEKNFFKLSRSMNSPDRRPEWMQEDGLPNKKKFAQARSATRQEQISAGIPSSLVQASRICIGLQSASNVLYKLLPMMDDFGACMARGMTPTESYQHLLNRELGISTSTPPVENISNYSKLDAENAQYINQLHNITGESPQMDLGDDGQALWRMPTFLGQHTRWHADKNSAIREYAWRMKSMFRPFLEEQDLTLQESAQSKTFDAEKAIPLESLQEFTGFDQLCIQALNDMHDLGAGMRASLLPGMKVGLSKMRVKKNSDMSKSERQLSILEPNPQYLEDKKGHFYQVDYKSMGTPYSLTKARANIYWRRLLDTNLLDPSDAFSLLLEAGAAKESERAQLQNIPLVNPNPPSRRGRTANAYNELEKNKRIDLRNHALASRLAELSADFQASDLNQSTLPQSAREWFRLIPFCPPEADGPQSFALNQSDSGKILLRWLNKTTAHNLKERTITWKKLREKGTQLTEHTLAHNLRESVGHTTAESQHRAWAHRIGGEQATDSPYTELWMMLTNPSKVWLKMSAERKADLAPLIESQYQSNLNKGRMPLDLNEAIQDLDAAVKQYPEIASFSEHPDQAGKFMRIHMKQDDIDVTSINQTSSRPLSWRGRRSPKQSYEMSPAAELPTHMQNDARVIPAIRLLDTLRSFIANRPQKTEKGISWMGKLYGFGANHIPGTSDAWKPRRALEPLLKIFDEIKHRDSSEGNGSGTFMFAGVPLRVLPTEMDYSALNHTSIYRSPDSPNETIRLMPGEFNSPLLDARTPYVVRTRNGAYFNNARALKDVQEFNDSIMSLDYLNIKELRKHNEQTQEELSTIVADQLVEQILNFEMKEEDGQLMGTGIINNNELIMRIAEDSGLCYELETKGLDELMPPQLSLLRLLREFMMIEYGPDPQAAYLELKRQTKQIARKESLAKRLKLCIMDMQKRMDTTAKRIKATR